MYTRKNFKKNALRFVMLFTIVFMILLMNSERSVYAAGEPTLPVTPEVRSRPQRLRIIIS